MEKEKDILQGIQFDYYVETRSNQELQELLKKGEITTPVSFLRLLISHCSMGLSH